MISQERMRPHTPPKAPFPDSLRKVSERRNRWRLKFPTDRQTLGKERMRAFPWLWRFFRKGRIKGYERSELPTAISRTPKAECPSRVIRRVGRTARALRSLAPDGRHGCRRIFHGRFPERAAERESADSGFTRTFRKRGLPPLQQPAWLKSHRRKRPPREQPSRRSFRYRANAAVRRPRETLTYQPFRPARRRFNRLWRTLKRTRRRRFRP